MNKTTRKWLTLEDAPRKLTVRGRSGIDSDCLVAHLDDAPDKPLWIVDGGAWPGLPLNPRGCFVCGIDVRALPEGWQQ